jgi:adenosyl cobinamide kinase/adenosyl cobinamide phosphate guanylyltransferase
VLVIWLGTNQYATGLALSLFGAGFSAFAGIAYVQEKLKGQKVPVVNDLHLWVKQLLQEGKPAEEIVLQYYKEHPDCIFICDEIGNGIVPMEKQEREYRERVGRLLIRLAGEAETVERIICGMGQKIK